MYKTILALTLMVFVVGGCQSSPSALDQAGTMVAQTITAAPSTATPSATSTPLSTDTPTPKPTSTPDFGATSTAQAAQILSEVSALVDKEVPYQDGYSAWQQTQPASIDMSGPTDKIQEIDDSPTAGNFILKSDVTWSTSGLILCGLVFRSDTNIQQGKQYRFVYLRLSGLPAWEIQVYEFGQFKNSPTGIKFSDAVNLDNEATNQLVLVVQDETFTLFINNKRQGKYYDYSKQRLEGHFAFLASQDSGTGNCTFENSWVWELP
jgi:hypothetical protein